MFLIFFFLSVQGGFLVEEVEECLEVAEVVPRIKSQDGKLGNNE